jgi:hypothetical protein
LQSILEARLETRKLAQNWRQWVKKIAKVARATLGNCKVFVFGSIARGTTTGASDVDILVVSSDLPKDNKSRGEIKAKIEEAAELPLYHPFEIHLTTEAEAESNSIYQTAIREGVPF